MDRKPRLECACNLIDRLERHLRNAFIGCRVTSSSYHLSASKRGTVDSRELVSELLGCVGVAPVDTALPRYAIALAMSDFEDAMQVAAARSRRARHIVTRNVRDYRLSPIPAITPQKAASNLS